MLDPSLGNFDFVVAMDSLIHYRPADIASALVVLGGRTAEKIAFTIAPRTPMLSAMHLAGKAFPRSDRSPAIVPVSARTLTKHVEARSNAQIRTIDRVSRGFYISQAMECRP